MICTNCYRYDLEAHDLFLSRIDNQWAMCCRRCAPTNFEFPNVGALDWMAAREDVKVPSNIWKFVSGFLLTDKQQEGAAQLPNNRRYERYALGLIAEYELPDDLKDRGSARVLNVSRGGVGLQSSRPLAIGKTYKVKISTTPGEPLEIKYNGRIEIARCRSLDNTRGYEIGGKFCEPDGAAKNSAADSALANIWYQRRWSGNLWRARMLDFNLNGVSFVVQEKLEPAEVIFVCIRGNSGLLRNQEIRVVMRAIGIEQIYADHYAIVAEFVKSSHPQPAKSPIVSPRTDKAK